MQHLLHCRTSHDKRKGRCQKSTRETEEDRGGTDFAKVSQQK